MSDHWLTQAHFGTARKPLPDWRDELSDDDSDDDIELDRTPQDVVDMLGFDPLDEKVNKLSKMVSQSDADYLDSSPYVEHCATCSMYIDSRTKLLGACSKVEGSINPDGWCRFYDWRLGGIIKEIANVRP